MRSAKGNMNKSMPNQISLATRFHQGESASLGRCCVVSGMDVAVDVAPPASSSKPTATNKTPIKDMESRMERADDLAELVAQMAGLQRPPDAKVVQELIDLHKQLKTDYVQIREELLSLDVEIRRHGEVQALYDRLTELRRSLPVWEEIGGIVEREFIPMDDDKLVQRLKSCDL